MSIDPALASSEIQEAPISLPFPTAWWGRVLYSLFITLLPAFAFWATDLLKPDWQNGELSSYLIFLLFPQASLVFIPLLVYSIICYLYLMFASNRFAQMFVIRVGIYTGILLALHFSLVALIFSLNSYIYALLPVWILPFICSPLYRWVVSKWTAVKVNKILFILILLGVLIEAVITKGGIVFLILIGL